jgi:hypothetical protein
MIAYVDPTAQFDPGHICRSQATVMTHVPLHLDWQGLSTRHSYLSVTQSRLLALSWLSVHKGNKSFQPLRQRTVDCRLLGLRSRLLCCFYS